MMQNCCGGMMWLWMLIGIIIVAALIMWIVKQSKK